MIIIHINDAGSFPAVGCYDSRQATSEPGPYFVGKTIKVKIKFKKNKNLTQLTLPYVFPLILSS